MSKFNYAYGNEVNYTIEKLTEKNKAYTESFDCGNEEINDYLKNKAIEDDTGVTYLVIDEFNTVVGYCTIACSGITHKYQDNIRTIPSIEIRYFAIDSKLQKLQYDKTDIHYYFSDYVMSEFMYKCSEIAENIIAARYIILYSVENAVKFYTRLGFCDFIASHHVYPQLLHFQVLPIFLRNRPNNSTEVARSTPEIFWVLAEWQVGHFPSRQDSEQDARDERREPELLPRITSHVLRHTACTNMVARGIALDVVKAMSMVSDWCQSRIKRRFQIRRCVKNPYL